MRSLLMKFLVLAHHGDDTAARVAALLDQRHPPGATRLASMEEIVCAPKWEHRLGPNGVQTELILGDGTMIRSDDIGVVFNRLRAVAVPRFAGAPDAERDYATMEMFALLLSWLRGLPCPVINPPSNQGLSGAHRHLAVWQLLAGKAGLPALRLRLTSNPRRYPDFALKLSFCPSGGASAASSAVIDRPTLLAEAVGVHDYSALVIGDAVLGSPTPDLDEPCRRLARSCNQHLLRIYFSSTLEPARPVVFTGADFFPDILDEKPLHVLITLLEETASKL